MKILRFLLSALREIALIPVAILLFPLGWFDRDPKSLPNGTKKVIVLVHGFSHNRSAWTLLGPIIKEKSGCPVFTINLGSPFKTIEQYAALLQKKLIEIQALSKDEKLDFELICHSMGGIVALHAALDSSKVHISKIVTICSPFKGAPLGWFISFFPPVRQMLPNSPYLIELADKAKKLEIPAIYHIACEADIISPASRSFLDGHPCQILLGHGHLSPLATPSIWSAIYNRLGPGM